MEIFGHPKIEPFSFYGNHLSKVIKSTKLKGFVFRPITFFPTFQKYSNEVCGGIQIHIINKKAF